MKEVVVQSGKSPDLATALTPVPMWTLPSDTLLRGALVIFAELLVCINEGDANAAFSGQL